MKNQMNVFEVFEGGSMAYVGLTTLTIVSTSSKMVAGLRNQFLGDSEVTCKKKFIAECRTSYATKVNNQLEREGKEANFKPRKSPYISYGNKNSALKFLRKDPNQWYFCYFAPQILSEVYYIDGKEATEIEVRTIKSCFRTRKGSGRQGTDKTVQVRNTKFASIQDIRFASEKNGEFTQASLDIPKEVQAEAFEIKKNEIQENA